MENTGLQSSKPNTTSTENSHSTDEQVSPVIVYYQKIADRAHTEIESVRSTYKWLVGSLGIFFAVFLAAMSFLYVTTIREMRFDLSSKAERIGKQAARPPAARPIDQQPMEKQDDAKAGRQKIDNAESKLKALDIQVSKANQTLDELKERSNFMMTVIAAQNDDGKAFDQLQTWANDSSYGLAKEASYAFVKIRTQYASNVPPATMSLSWKNGVDPSKFSFSRLKQEYSRVPLLYHAGLVKYIWQRDDIPKKDRMEFLMDVLKTDGSLTARYYAGRFFAQETSINWSPFMKETLTVWWEENRDSIEQ